MNAPHNAAEAATQLSEIGAELAAARDNAKKHENCHVRLEHLYRTSKSRALLNPDLDGSNQAQRDAAAHETDLTADMREDGGRVAQAMGLDGTVPLTVGDLRWLRDRAKSLAESSSARAYDLRAQMSGWMTVASMAKSEMELATPGVRDVG